MDLDKTNFELLN